jgi:protoporphyrinogen oxidase
MKKRIAVLGGGAMGLAAAYQLALDGYQPVVFEADDRVGGMAAAFDFNNLTIERYYHYYCTSDSAFLQVLDELGLAEKIHWVETKMGYWYLNKLQQWGNPLALLKFQGLSPLAKFRYGLHIFTSTRRKNWDALDKMEATSWLKRWIGNKTYDTLWRTLFEYKFYGYANNLSAAWIWSRIHRIGLSRYDLFREKLGYLEGGTHTFLNAIQTAIEASGGEVRLSSPVSKVVIEAGAIKGVEALGKFEAFGKVVSTIPLPHVTYLFPDLPSDTLNAYRSVNNIAVVCVIAKLTKRVSENFWLNTNDEEMDIPGLVEYANLRPLDHHVVYVPFYMPKEHPKYQESDQIFKDKVQRYLKKINPALNDDDFLDLHVSRYKYAQPVCEPNFLEKLPPIAAPVEGLWIADTSYYYPEDRNISDSIHLGREMAKMAIQ